MKIALRILIVFCFYYTSVHFIERAQDVYWLFNTSASVWSNFGCEAHPEIRFDPFRADIVLLSVNNDPYCAASSNW